LHSIFDYPFWEWVLARAMVCSHRVSVQTTVVSGTVWLQFVMQVWTGGRKTPGSGNGGRMG